MEQQVTPILTINGSDGTGGAGIQADIKTISALGGRALSAITSITAQNTLGIQEFYDLPAETIKGQIEAIVNDMQPAVVKVGMIRRADTVAQIAQLLRQHKPRHVIYDPVIVSSQNEMLMAQEVVHEVRRSLLPLCSLVLMKRADAERLTQTAINTAADLNQAVKSLLAEGCQSVLLQGSHMATQCLTDVFATAKDSDPTFLPSLFGEGEVGTRHGLSGSLSAAIATFVNGGNAIFEAVVNARNYIAQLQPQHTGIIGRSGELFNEFTHEITQHHRTNSDVKFYADKLNVSARYLAQVTRRITGKAPKAIIDEYLTHEIEQQLAFTPKTIQEIAYAYGFRSQAHLAKFFKNINGLAPSEFRKEILLNKQQNEREQTRTEPQLGTNA